MGDSEETDGCLCQRESSIPTADVLNSTFFSLAVASVRERERGGEGGGGGQEERGVYPHECMYLCENGHVEIGFII